jgi:hypothetical protein
MIKLDDIIQPPSTFNEAVDLLANVMDPEQLARIA